MKKLKFEVIKEDWGEQMCDETGEQGATVIDGGGAEDSGEQEAGECSNVTRPCKIMRLASTNLTTSLITEYFPKTKRMEQQTGFEEEEQWFETWALDYRGRGGEEVTQRAQMGDQSEGGVSEQLSSRSLEGGDTRVGVGEEIPRSQGDQSKGGVGEQLSSGPLDGGEFIPCSLCSKGELQIVGVGEAPRSLEGDQPEKMMGGETRVGAGEEIQRSQGDQSKGGVGEKHSSRSLDGGETRGGVGEDIP